MLSLADALGLEGAEISATPTHRRDLARLDSAPAQLHAAGAADDRRSRRDRPARRPRAGRARRASSTRRAALTRLAEIEARPLERRWYVRLAAYSLAGAAVTPVLGGGWRDVLAGGVVGLVVGVVAIAAQRAARAEPMIAPLAAVAASFAAAALGLARTRGVARRRDAGGAGHAAARHGADDRGARARDGAPPVGGGEHRERARAAARPRLRGRPSVARSR